MPETLASTMALAMLLVLSLVLRLWESASDEWLLIRFLAEGPEQDRVLLGRFMQAVRESALPTGPYAKEARAVQRFSAALNRLYQKKEVCSFPLTSPLGTSEGCQLTDSGLRRLWLRSARNLREFPVS